MADDNEVTLKTKGKTAFTPTSGSGRGRKAPLAKSVSGGSKVRTQSGRKAVARKQGR